MNDNTLRVETDNPAEFLRAETGTFEVTSPYGQVFCVTCRRGSRMNVRQISEAKDVGTRQQRTWKIRRVNDATQWAIDSLDRREGDRWSPSAD